MNTKFFKVAESDEYYSLYVCHKDTPIPTIKDIKKRNPLVPYSKDTKVIEISMETFLALHAQLLESLADSAEDMAEWAPNTRNGLRTWTYWGK